MMMTQGLHNEKLHNLTFCQMLLELPERWAGHVACTELCINNFGLETHETPVHR